MVLKVDISKSYGMVSWTYLENVMLQMGFAQRWVDIVMMCVQIVIYYIAVNNFFEIGPIYPEHGQC